MQNHTLPHRNILRSIMYVVLATALLLLIPWVAMQFTNEVDWTLSDFVIMGILLSGTGLTYVLSTWKVRSSKYRAIIALVILGVFLLIWADLAVGIFNIPGISGS